jgi:hypothetical protein
MFGPTHPVWTRCVSFYGVEPPVTSVDVKPSTSKHGRRFDGGTEVALPETRAVRAIEGVQHASIGTKVDAGAKD